MLSIEQQQRRKINSRDIREIVHYGGAPYDLHSVAIIGWDDDYVFNIGIKVHLLS
nr:hypothetical protein [Mycoplasmopsis bovis]